jgi:beta-aspartyl-dipeptidase (metallo-type)
VRTLDCTGLSLVPGLVDLHAHTAGGGGEAGPETKVPAPHLSAFTLAGVTSVVGLLGTDCTTRSMEELVARTKALRSEGLSAWCWTGGYEVPPRTLTGSVRRDLAFVEEVLGCGEVAVSDHRSSQPTYDELVRLAADCHVGGLLTGKAGVLHLHLGDGPRGLQLVRRALDESEVPARVFHPTHVNRNRRLFAEALDLAKRGPCIDVTAFPPSDDPSDTPDEVPAHEALLQALAAGVPAERLTCSSDGGGCLPVFDEDGRLTSMDVGSPSSLLQTVQALCARGLGLGAALQFFTENPARLLRLARKGRIAPGLDADLLLLDEAHSLRHVFAGGEWMVQDGRAVRLGRFERAAHTGEPQ